MAILTKSIIEARAGKLEVFEYAYQFQDALFALWIPEPEPELELKEESPSEYKGPLFSRSGPEPSTWSIAFTPTFQKSITNIDKKLQGRILLALSELSEFPVSLLGDTKKPLTGELKGLWRYRLGAYRLIYEPDEKTLKVILLEFSARGSSYK